MHFRILSLFLMLSACVSATGCKSIRNVEQWKCDNWGLCHFGIKPTRLAGTENPSSESLATDCGCGGSEKPFDPQK
jgi:hypothetical protein